MNVLVINCGSSSLKYQLIESEKEAVLAKGLCERIGIDGSAITHTPAGGEKKMTEIPMKDHTDAVKLVIEQLTGKITFQIFRTRTAASDFRPKDRISQSEQHGVSCGRKSIRNGILLQKRLAQRFDNRRTWKV